MQDKILDISKNLNEGVYLSKTFENIKTKIQNGKAYVSFMTKTKFSQGSDIICDGKIDGLENIVRIDEVEIVNKLKFGENVVDSYSTGVVATNKNGDTTNIKVEY